MGLIGDWRVAGLATAVEGEETMLLSAWLGVFGVQCLLRAVSGCVRMRERRICTHGTDGRGAELPSMWSVTGKWIATSGLVLVWVEPCKPHLEG